MDSAIHFLGCGPTCKSIHNIDQPNPCPSIVSFPQQQVLEMWFLIYVPLEVELKVACGLNREPFSSTAQVDSVSDSF